MDSFKVKIPGMRNVISEQEKMIRELSGLQNNLDDVKRSLRFKIAGRQRIDSRLKEQSGRTSEMRQQMSGITSALADITALYEQTEMALCQNGKQQSETRQKEKQQSAEQQQSKEKAGGTTETFIGSTASYEFGRDADDDEGIEIGVRIRETYTDSAFQDEVVLGNKDGTHLSHELTIGKTEAYGEAFAEICTIDPETGETIFNPAIGVEAGFSYTALSLTEQAQLGNDNLGIYGEVGVEAGKVEAKADAKVSMRDSDGNINPTVHAGASAGILLGEASAKGGAKILGTDVGIKGSVNYGIGAHADIGLEDGKFSLDIGATLGVGGSISLEIDIGGTIDAVCGFVSSLWGG